MKDAHLTLRLPEDLVRALSRMARDRGLAKSHLVREALARYVAVPSAHREARVVTAGEVARQWNALPHLSKADAVDFSKELQRARKALPSPKGAWE